MADETPKTYIGVFILALLAPVIVIGLASIGLMFFDLSLAWLALLPVGILGYFVLRALRNAPSASQKKDM